MKTKALACSALFVSIAASSSFAQTPTFRCTLSDGGRTYSIYGTNTSNQLLNCTVRCDLVRPDGGINEVRCQAPLERGARNKYICGNTENPGWSRVQGISHSC
jgi:hypothetical protein